MDGRNAKMIQRYYPRYRSPKSTYQDCLDQSVRRDSATSEVADPWR